MAQSVFISDLHLSEGAPELWRTFADFCASEVRSGDRLFILGDLTDYWIGDDDDSDFAAELASRLKGVADRGVELAFLRGNRDFLMGRDFCDRVGMRLLPDPCVLRTGEQAVLLTHGDLLCTLDEEYLEVRKRFRARPWQRQFLGLSLAERRRILQQFRRDSTASKEARGLEVLDAVPATAERFLRHWHATAMIHGHTHRPGLHEHRLGDRVCRRWVLSDWRPETRFLRLKDGGAAASAELRDYPPR